MTDDPRAILKAVGVECAEVDDYRSHPLWVRTPHGELTIDRIQADAAILALARLAAKYKSAYEAERGHVLRGPTGTEWIRRDLAEEEIAKHKPK